MSDPLYNPTTGKVFSLIFQPNIYKAKQKLMIRHQILKSMKITKFSQEVLAFFFHYKMLVKHNNSQNVHELFGFKTK